ncbi:MAG: PilZ domain-containing protein [Thermoanaerobaculia bacterium]
MSDDRRRLERIRLHQPPAARIGDLPGRILDIGLLGARIETEMPLEIGSTHIVTFSWSGHALKIEGKVTRCEFQSILSEARGERIFFSGIEFTGSNPESGTLLRRLISEEVTTALENQKANARGALAEIVEDVPFLRTEKGGGRVRRAEAPSFVCCRLGSGGSWKKTLLTRPAQPVDGFTIRLRDTEDEIERLCRAYEEAGPDVRKLIRLCAEMTTLDEDDVQLPPTLA